MSNLEMIEHQNEQQAEMTRETPHNDHEAVVGAAAHLEQVGKEVAAASNDGGSEAPESFLQKIGEVYFHLSEAISHFFLALFGVSEPNLSPEHPDTQEAARKTQISPEHLKNIQDTGHEFRQRSEQLRAEPKGSAPGAAETPDPAADPAGWKRDLDGAQKLVHVLKDGLDRAGRADASQGIVGEDVDGKTPLPEGLTQEEFNDYVQIAREHFAINMERGLSAEDAVQQDGMADYNLTDAQRSAIDLEAARQLLAEKGNPDAPEGLSHEDYEGYVDQTVVALTHPDDDAYLLPDMSSLTAAQRDAVLVGAQARIVAEDLPIVYKEEPGPEPDPDDDALDGLEGLSDAEIKDYVEAARQELLHPNDAAYPGLRDAELTDTQKARLYEMAQDHIENDDGKDTLNDGQDAPDAPADKPGDGGLPEGLTQEEFKQDVSVAKEHLAGADRNLTVEEAMNSDGLDGYNLTDAQRRAITAEALREIAAEAPASDAPTEPAAPADAGAPQPDAPQPDARHEVAAEPAQREADARAASDAGAADGGDTLNRYDEQNSADTLSNDTQTVSDTAKTNPQTESGQEQRGITANNKTDANVPA